MVKIVPGEKTSSGPSDKRKGTEGSMFSLKASALESQADSLASVLVTEKGSAQPLTKVANHLGLCPELEVCAGKQEPRQKENERGPMKG